MSKLTLHFQGIPGWANNFVTESGVRYAKLIDPPGQNPLPGARIIGRTYMPDGESNAMIRHGHAGGEAWFNRWRSFYESRPYIWCWEGPNEPQPMSDRSFRTSLDGFTYRWTELMHQHGWKVAGMCWGVGWPDRGHAREMAGSVQHLDYLAVHEYSAKQMADGVGWYCLRYRNTVAELESAGIRVPPILITECGIDGGVLGQSYARTGWKSYASEDQYLAQLKWYDGELKKDSYIEAATIFVAGPNQDWIDFEVTESLAAKLATYIKNDVPVDPPPVDPEYPLDNGKANGIDVSMFQGEINWGLVAGDGYEFAMIRASGPNADRSAMIADPRFIQNYIGAGEAGLLRGAYHGLHPDYAGQARLFVDTVGDRTLELGYYSDIENRALTDAKCNLHLEAVDRNISAKLGITPGRHARVYTSPGFMSGRDTSWATGRGLWIAHWAAEDKIYVPEPWDKWEFWQYTSDGSVSGISGRVDLDQYNGSVEMLRALYGAIDISC